MHDDEQVRHGDENGGATKGPAPLGAIGALGESAVELLADANPMDATMLGIGGRDDRWPDMSPAGHDARRRLHEDLLARATATPVDGPDQELAQRVMVDTLSEAIARHTHGEHLLDLNNIASTFQSVHDALDLTVEPHDQRARLLAMPEALADYRSSLAEGLRTQTVVARRQVRAAIEQGRVWSGPEGFAEFSGIDGGDEAVDVARRAYAELADWLEAEYLPHAAEADAVGEQRYLRLARDHLGTVIDPADTYAWGWSELGRVSTRLREVCARIDPDAPVAEVVERLRTDPDRAAGSVEEFLAAMQQRQLTALDQLGGTHFEVDPRIRAIEVKAGPPGGALAPYYTPPSEDFARPGAVWYPLGGRTVFPLWDEVTTAHHEGFPGHHLQVGTQMALGDRLSRFHRVMVWKPGSGEGWALYAEHIMDELGYLDLPDYEAGFVAAQLLRCARVVIDIGLHLGYPIPASADNPIGFHPGEPWSYALAVEMLTDIVFQDRAFAESEVTRYLGWPGQAISYKVGERAILELRAEAMAAATVERPFDPVGFHSAVLRAGAVGLDVLTEVVRSAVPHG